MEIVTLISKEQTENRSTISDKDIVQKLKHLCLFTSENQDTSEKLNFLIKEISLLKSEIENSDLHLDKALKIKKRYSKKILKLDEKVNQVRAMLLETLNMENK